jgi:hypothetical protein
MTAERFTEILAHRDWMRTEEMVAALDRAKFWDASWLENEAVFRVKSEYARNMARTITRKDGRHVFVNVVKTTADGEKTHIYKQQTLFNVNDYRYVVSYHKQMAVHHIAEANRFARDCETYTGTQIPMPFPDKYDLPEIENRPV